MSVKYSKLWAWGQICISWVNTSWVNVEGSLNCKNYRQSKIIAYPSPTTTHLIACILFRSASSVLFTLTETDSQRKVQRRWSACSYRKLLYTSLTLLPLLPFRSFSAFLFLHFAHISSSCFVGIFLLLLNKQMCKWCKIQIRAVKQMWRVLKGGRCYCSNNNTRLYLRVPHFAIIHYVCICVWCVCVCVCVLQ